MSGSKSFVEESVDEETGEVTDASVDQAYASWFAALPADRRSLLAVNPHDLQGEFTHAAGKFAWAFEGLAAAEEAHERALADTKLDRARARLAILLDKKIEKKPSKDVLDAMVEAHPLTRAAVEREHAARREYRRWQGDIEAMRQRRDYLVQLGARSRVEPFADPVVREKNDKRRTERRDE